MKSLNLNDKVRLTVPDNWEVKIDENFTSLFDPENGVGALQFSIYHLPNISSIDLIKELKEYLAGKYDGLNIDLMDSCAYCNVTYKDKYWKYWLLKAGGSLVFGSYNCDEQDKDIETLAIDGVIQSISTR